MSKIITKIEAQKKKENRVNIFIDGEFSFGCSSELIYYHNLTKGKVINSEELQEVINEDNYLTGKTKALKYIESSLKSEFQVRENLEKKEYDEVTINRVITFLKDYKFIDDEYYAKAFVKQNIKTQGKNNIKFKLIKRGIPEDIILETLDCISTDEEEIIAVKIAEKKAKLLCKNETNINKVKTKLNTFLISKGYNFDTIKSVLNKIELNINEECDEETQASPSIYNDGVEDSINNEDDSSAINIELKRETLLNIAEKRYDRLVKSEKDGFKVKKKLQDFLLRKGYSYSDIKSVVNAIISGDEYNY